MTTSSLNRPGKPHYPEKDDLQIRKPFVGVNFGEVEVDWDKRIATLRIINGEGHAVRKNEFSF